MTLREQIRRLEQDLQDERQNTAHYRAVCEHQKKQLAIIRKAWSKPHVDDLRFMREFEAENKDRDLFDVFNRMLYSFGRPDACGCVRTMLSSAWA